MFRKPEFDMIYYAYLNKSPFKYYVSILGGWGVRPCLFCLFRRVGVQNSGKSAYIILARSLNLCNICTCTHPGPVNSQALEVPLTRDKEGLCQDGLNCKTGQAHQDIH